MGNRGTIKRVKGQIAEVEFLMEKPQITDLLFVEEDPTILMEVATSASDTSFYCFVLGSTHKLSRGTTIINSKKPIEIPIGEEVLGRIMNLFGQPLDDKPPIQTKEKRTIYVQGNQFDKIVLSKAVVETGIKAIDFFSPI